MKPFPVVIINMYACTLIKSVIYVAQNSFCFCFALLIHVCIYMLWFVLELKGCGGDPSQL